MNRRAILRNVIDPKFSSTKLLERYSRDVDPLIRAGVALHPRTSHTVLLTLTRDPDEIVRDAARKAQRSREKHPTPEPEQEI